MVGGVADTNSRFVGWGAWTVTVACTGGALTAEAARVTVPPAQPEAWNVLTALPAEFDRTSGGLKLPQFDEKLTGTDVEPDTPFTWTSTETEVD